MIFPENNISCQNPKLPLQSSSCCPKQGSWTPGARAADADSKVESASRGSRGINGCPSWGFGVKLQPWPWKRVLRRVSPAAGVALARGAADAELSLVQLCWSRQQAGLAAGPSPERRLPLIYVWGSHCFSPPRFPLISSPSPAASSCRNLCLQRP